LPEHIFVSIFQLYLGYNGHPDQTDWKGVVWPPALICQGQKIM